MRFREETMFRVRTLVLIAALNEEEGIGYTLAELSQVLEDPAFLVVDGNSIDRTVEIAKESGAEVLVQKGRGKGDALAQAMAHLNGDFEYVILIDADYTYPAEYLPEMIRILERNPSVGMVCGNRFNGRIHLGEMHNLLYFGNRLLAFTHNLMNGVQMQDPLTGMRVLRWETIKDWKPKSKGFDLEVELNRQVERKGYDIVEVPIHYRRRLGEKKLKLRHGLTIFRRILAESLT
jgi:glycosyltransferase involved in cell wall biosynthesis